MTTKQIATEFATHVTDTPGLEDFCFMGQELRDEIFDNWAKTQVPDLVDFEEVNESHKPDYEIETVNNSDLPRNPLRDLSPTVKPWVAEQYKDLGPKLKTGQIYKLEMGEPYQVELEIIAIKENEVVIKYLNREDDKVLDSFTLEEFNSFL